MYKWHGHKSRELSWGEFEKLQRLMKEAERKRKGLWGEYREIMECLRERGQEVFMGKILDFPVEYWSDRDREKLREIQEDILLAKAHGDYTEDFELSDEEWAERLKENIERDIKEGKLFSWLKEFKED